MPKQKSVLQPGLRQAKAGLNQTAGIKPQKVYKLITEL